MNIRRLIGVSGLLIFFTLGPAEAQADPITVTFTVFPAPGDPVNTTRSTGSFTFDSSLIPPGGGQVQDVFGLDVMDINFFWSSTLWTTANAGVGELAFSESGSVLAFVLGGMPTGRGIYGWISAPASQVLDDIFARSFAGVGGAADITYTNAGVAGSLTGRLVSDSLPAPIPEPTSFLLVATGAAVLARVRSRRTHPGPKKGADPAVV